jgi:hypothetical protein
MASNAIDLTHVWLRNSPAPGRPTSASDSIAVAIDVSMMLLSTQLSTFLDSRTRFMNGRYLVLSP